MGRTISSFRIAAVIEDKEWKSFKNSLDKSERKILDDMFAISHLYNSACSYSEKYVRIHPIFMSIIFHYYKRLMQLTKSSRLKPKENMSTNNKIEKRFNVKLENTYTHEITK
jgi:hypothetical protein